MHYYLFIHMQTHFKIETLLDMTEIKYVHLCRLAALFSNTSYSLHCVEIKAAAIRRDIPRLRVAAVNNF